LPPARGFIHRVLLLLGVFLTFLNGADFAYDPSPYALLGNLFLPLGLFGVGVAAVVSSIGKDAELRPGRALMVLWFLLPLVLLSTRDVKFPRYLFYILPPAALFIARGLTAIRLKTPVMLALAAVVIVAPRSPRGGQAPSATIALPRARRQKRASTSDRQLGEHRQAVSSSRGTCNRRYRGDVSRRWKPRLHSGGSSGFSTAPRRQFFLRLLAEAKERGSRLWFVDTLPLHNYCHTPGREPVSIDCRLKYRRFYEACLPSSPNFEPTCARLRF
jgi:hypothetical protein